MKSYSSKETHRFTYLIGETDSTYHEISLKLGLSDSAMKILYTICDVGDACPLQDICYYSGLSKQTVNSALRKLEAEEVIYLEPFHGKHKIVCLTDKGKELAEHTVIQIMKAENEIFDSWPKEDVEQYLKLTEKYLTMLQEKAKTLGAELKK